MNARALVVGLLRLLSFVLIGVVVAFVGELQYSVFIRGDVPNLVGSVGFNAMYLTLAGGVVALLLRWLGRRPLSAVLITLLAGSTGLMIEWFIIGNSPWGNPAASEAGMFAYWACMVVVPLALLDPSPRTRPLRRAILRYGLLYTLLALAMQLIPNADIRYAYHIWSVILGYIGLLALTAFSLVRGWRPEPASASPAGSSHLPT